MRTSLPRESRTADCREVISVIWGYTFSRWDTIRNMSSALMRFWRFAGTGSSVYTGKPWLLKKTAWDSPSSPAF